VTPFFSLRLPPRRQARWKAWLALTALVVALSALAAPPPGAAYSCSAGEGRIYDCRRPVKVPKKPRTEAQETGRIGVTPLVLFLAALVGTLALPIGFDRASRRDEARPDRMLR